MSRRKANDDRRRGPRSPSEPQKIFIPKGLFGPNETVVVEIPEELHDQPVVIAKRHVQAEPPSSEASPSSPNLYVPSSNAFYSSIPPPPPPPPPPLPPPLPTQTPIRIPLGPPPPPLQPSEHPSCFPSFCGPRSRPPSPPPISHYQSYSPPSIQPTTPFMSAPPPVSRPLPQMFCPPSGIDFTQMPIQCSSFQCPPLPPQPPQAMMHSQCSPIPAHRCAPPSMHFPAHTGYFATPQHIPEAANHKMPHSTMMSDYGDSSFLTPPNSMFGSYRNRTAPEMSTNRCGCTCGSNNKPPDNKSLDATEQMERRTLQRDLSEFQRARRKFIQNSSNLASAAGAASSSSYQSF